MRKTMVAAHTGCGIHPDNTLASFMEAMELGADIAEVDVRVAHDGTAILMHDDSPYLHQYSYEQLNRPEIRRLLEPVYEEYEIATLEQVLELSLESSLKLNLDLKAATSIDPAVQLIRKFDAVRRVYITGCSDHITTNYPDIQVMLNTPDELTLQQQEQYDDYAAEVCREAVQGGYTGLNVNGLTLRLPLIEHAHACGLQVWVYTVNDRPNMELLLRGGVDAITTRKPDVLITLLNDRNP
ncbi:glycerophosphodiester phosphodiesterase [Paenibacillus dokdonensis]|uniref:glycerophosphodiester phosphodiesterase n=1 Tax=Paenibacillus dokdonensis TaxID=2567944 RepID=UPI0010A7A491|nr:glycerophosphodiester phosphodiesterase [Paenibacillus dokdonensis]